MMKIVADRAIPFVETFFQSIGNVVLRPGREITASDLVDADVVVVRTVTRVNADLLDGTAVRFVATATSGHDHIDTDYLLKNNIGFAGAPGCNARSVAEYVLSAVFALADQNRIDLTGKTVGIIGCGHAGSTVLEFFRALGMKCLINDPPLQSADSRFRSHGLDEISTADVITLHVPLVTDGPWTTHHLIDEKFLSRLRADVILINTSRGGVVDEAAICRFMDNSPYSSVVLDVWEGEPGINPGLLQRAAIATAHIAGYSTDARLRGTFSVFKQVCHWADKSYNNAVMPVLPGNGIERITIDDDTSEMEAVQMAVLAAYDVRSDSAALRRLLEINEDGRGRFFADLRNNYPIRREFTAMSVSVPESAVDLRMKLVNLGFRVNQVTA